jgi:hypothetical protein
MKFFTLSLLTIILLFGMNTRAQTLKLNPPAYDKVTIGLGMGFDYGGFGASLLVYPAQHIGIFGGVGYALAGVGYNGGIRLRMTPANGKVNLCLIGMYGYNSAIYIQNQKSLNKIFYGATVGIGLDTRYRPEKSGYWSFALMVPFRGSEVNDYMNELKRNHGVEFKNELFPIGISVGYRFILF